MSGEECAGPAFRFTNTARAFVAATAVLLLLIVQGVDASVDAAFPGASGVIAFDDQWEILSINPDGSGSNNLPNPTNGVAPAWSADGRKIAFDGFTGLFNEDI